MDKTFTKVEFTGPAARLDQVPNDGRGEVVLAGRSNVGKSSLVNALAGRKSLARVSQTPGKTQMVLYFLVNDSFYITDLPGYGFTANRQTKASFSKLIDSYFQIDRPIKLALHMMDIRHKPSKEDLIMQEFLKAQSYPTAIVLSKGDKLSRQQIRKQTDVILKELNLSENQAVFVVSNPKRQGLEELGSFITATMSGDGKETAEIEE